MAVHWLTRCPSDLLLAPRAETSRMKRDRVLGRWLLFIVNVVALAGVEFVWAQTATTGAIYGVVRGPSGPLPGAVVTVRSPALQGAQHAITDGNGAYKISGLAPGRYQIKFFYAGSVAERVGVVVSVNRATPGYGFIDTTKLTGGEVIVIEGFAPSIDPTTTARGAKLDREYFTKVPFRGRSFQQALEMTPGANPDDLGLSFSGSSSLENQYVIDGINTTELLTGEIGTPLINDFVQEIEVNTGGYNAEFGRATGGFVNLVTKQGSNTFHGSVFSYVAPGFLRADERVNQIQSSSIQSQFDDKFNADVGFDLGGPIVRDLLWFYVGVAPQFQRTRVNKITKSRVDRNQDGIPDVDDDTGLLMFDEIDRRGKNQDTRGLQGIVKLNLAVTPQHQGQLSFIGIPQSAESVEVNGDPSALVTDRDTLVTDLAGRWTSRFNDNQSEIEAIAGWHRFSSETNPADIGARSRPQQVLLGGNLGDWSRLGFESALTQLRCTDGTDDDLYPNIVNCPMEGSSSYVTGGSGILDDARQQRLSLKGAITHRGQAFGSHELKAGLDVEDNRISFVRGFSGGAAFTSIYPPPDAPIPGLREAFRLVNLGTGDEICRDSVQGTEILCTIVDQETVRGNTLTWSAFLRDSWQVHPGLTLNYGIRYEEQRLRYAPHLRGTTDPVSGEFRGKNALRFRDMWAPRVGAVYDWTQEGRAKLYGHWGRFYESIPMKINARPFSGEALYRQQFLEFQCGAPDPVLGPTGPGCLAQGQPPIVREGVVGRAIVVAPGTKPQHMDEIVLGVEYEPMKDLSIGISFQHRSLGRVLEDVSVDGGRTFILTNPGRWSASQDARLVRQIEETQNATEKARLQGQLEAFRQIRNFDTARRDYNAIQLTAKKRFANGLFLQGSYTYSRTRGNYPGLFSANNGQVDPNINAQFDFIETVANRDGALDVDSPHVLKLDGYYTARVSKNNALTSGIRFRGSSGRPINVLGSHYQYGSSESFILPRGTGGRTDYVANVDLHLQYARQFSNDITLEAFVDLFSVFNRQATSLVDEEYTTDDVNPIVGGKLEDLVFLKAQDGGGNETATPATRNRDFGNTVERLSPFAARIGVRVTF